MTTATKGKAMGKPRKLRDDRLDDMTDARVLPQLGEPYPQPVETLAEVEGETTAIVEGEVVEVPKPRRYSPPACSACTAQRPAGTNYTYTNGTETVINTDTERIITRSCKCKFCGNTWPDKTIIRH